MSVLLIGCEDVNEFGAGLSPALTGHYIVLAQNQVTLDAKPQGSQRMEVKAVASAWQFKGMEKWLTVTPAEGNSTQTVEVTATENLSGDQTRSSVFQLISTDPTYEFTQMVSATQKAATPYLNLEESSMVVPAGQTTKSIAVEANIEWVSSVQEAWLAVSKSPDGKALVITVKENTGLETRTAVILVTGVLTRTLTVTQAAPNVPVSNEKTLSYGNAGGSYQLTIEAEVAWTAQSTADWLLLTPESGQAGKTVMVVEALPNAALHARTGLIILYFGSAEVLSINVQQEGISLKVSPQILTFQASGGTHLVQVQSNTTWEVLSQPSWVTVSDPTGNGDKELTVTCAENERDVERQDVLVIGRKGTELQERITLVQRAKYFSVTPTTFAELPSKGGTHQVHIVANEHWVASSSSSWMQLSTKEGQGDIDVTLTAPDNPSVHGRIDTTTFIPAFLQPVRVMTRQAARYLMVDVAEMYFFARGGTSNAVSINTDGTYTITGSDSWMILHQEGNVFTVEVTKNETGLVREGNVVIALTGLNAGEELKVVIPVTQRDVDSKIDVEPFTPDRQWDVVVSHGTVTVTGFGEDTEWE